MWIHVIICVMVTGLAIAWKLGKLLPEGIPDEKSRQLFIIVALGANVLGFLVTLTSGGGEIYSEQYRMEKSENGIYTQEFLLSMDDREEMAVSVQVPEKETEQEETISEVKPLTEEEKREKELLEAIALYNQQKNDPEYYYLPSEWDGRSLVWEAPKDSSGTFLAALGLIAAFALMLKKAKEKQEQEAKRRDQLLMDYPGLIMKFTLLIQAGMTVRKAFGKIALDYRRKISAKKRCAYEEIVVTCNEMDSGIAELEAYRRFGERCGQIKYKTFATLLIQNLQKGSRRMADVLEKEAMEAWDERKRKARVLGEAAATKLLVPMVLMLIVVMAIIMIPAFLSFSG